MVQLPIDNHRQIVVTASRAPESRSRERRPASRSSTSERIERLGEPLVPALLRLVPSTAVATSRAGGIADRSPHPRRRGQSHPAVHRRHPRQRPGRRQRAAVRAAQCRPRLADRGRARPAIGAVGIRSDRRGDRGQRRRDGAAACRGRPKPARSAFAARQRRRRSAADNASLSRRRSAGSARRASTASTATATATAIATCRARLRGELAGRAQRSSSAPRASRSTGRSEFDGYRSRHLRSRRHARQQPQPPRRGPAVGRASATARRRWQRHAVGASLLGSSQPQFPRRRARSTARAASRATLDGQVEHRFVDRRARPSADRRGEAERETFHARDVIFGGFTDQDRNRGHQALTVEWRGEAEPARSATSPSATTASTASRTRPPCAPRLLAKLGGGVRARRLLWRRHRAADLLRSLRLLSREFRWQSVA